MDEITQVTLINCILRYYLLNNNIELAKSFLSKINFKENVSTNEDVRYLYYLGKIEAIQQNYSDAYIHLTNSFRKAPEKTAEDFKSLVTKNIIVVQLLMGEIPDVKNLLTQSQIKDFLIYKPYLELLKVVRHGNLEEFRNLLKLYEKSFENDGMFTLIQRIRHVLIKAGLRNINLSYSRISIKDIAEKLKLESEKEAEYIIAKAIRDGVFLAKINHEEGYVQSKEIKDIYSTFEPQRSYQSRIMFLNKVYNDAQQAMKYSEKQKEDKDIEKAELEEEDEMDRAFEDFQ
jgi:26S proteasome regulatory subunit N3